MCVASCVLARASCVLLDASCMLLLRVVCRVLCDGWLLLCVVCCVCVVVC